MTTTIKLGQRVRDRLTHFEGLATGRAEYLTGCATILVQPRCKQGEPMEWVESRWIDEPRLEITDGNVLELNPTPERGADSPAPRK